jgi:hypothetical protein
LLSNSDQYSQYASKVITATVRDATHTLDGILDNQTVLPIDEHTTDTHGYTEMIFGAYDLLGLRFAPRIRDLDHQRLYRHGISPDVETAELLKQGYSQDKAKRSNRTAEGRYLSTRSRSVERSCTVFCGRAGVDPGCFEPGVAEELGDDDEVGASAHQRGGEGVPEDVGGRVVLEAGGRGDRGDDLVGAPDAEALPALVEEQGGTVVGAGPVGALGEPADERRVQLRWIGTWRARSPLPRIRRKPLRADRAMSSTSSATTSLIRAPA